MMSKTTLIRRCALAALTALTALAVPLWPTWAAGPAGTDTAATAVANPASPEGGSVAIAPPASSADTKASKAPAAQEPRIILGNDKVINPPKPVPKAEGAASSYKFEEAPLLDIVHMMLRDVLKANYIVYPPITGNVTLATNQDVTPDQAILMLESALQANGLVMARDTRGTYHIGRPDALKGIVPGVRLSGKDPLPPGTGTIIVPLQFIGAAEMAAILRPMMPGDALVRVDALRNILVMVGNRTQAEGWLDMVNTFDIDMLKGMSVGVFPLRYATVREVETALKLLSSGPAALAGGAAAPGGTTTGGSAPAANSMGIAAGGAAAAASAEPTTLSGMRILAVERLNAVLIVTPRAAHLETARLWIEKLDKPGTNSAEPQLHVYPVQNGSARNLANVLNGLFGQGGSGTSTGTGVAPGLNTTTNNTGFGNNAFGNTGMGSTGLGNNSFGNSGTNQLNSFNRTGTTGTTANAQQQGSGITAINLGSGLRVIADEINNAILVYGTRNDYEKIESALRRLDVPPTQVLIEASIIEVTLNNDLQYGLQWSFTDKNRGGYNGTGTLSTSAGGVLGGAAAGFSYSLTNPLGNVRAVLNALADKSLLNVISSPSLMVLDNHTASISVGNQQPVQAGQTITTGGNVSSNITYKDTGVTLAVTPSVNAGNMVTLQIAQSVTDVGNIDAATGQRAFLQRQINSKVAVRSGETLVLGGLIRDNTTNGRSGVPLLSDLPLIGGLFGSTTVNKNRTELLVVLTPRVVRSDQDLREIGAELRGRMKGLQPSANPVQTP